MYCWIYVRCSRSHYLHVGSWHSLDLYHHSWVVLKIWSTHRHRVSQSVAAQPYRTKLRTISLPAQPLQLSHRSPDALIWCLGKAHVNDTTSACIFLKAYVYSVWRHLILWWMAASVMLEVCSFFFLYFFFDLRIFPLLPCLLMAIVFSLTTWITHVRNNVGIQIDILLGAF